MSEKPWLSDLTFLGFYIIAAIDSGKGGEVSINDIYDGLENGKLFSKLTEIYPKTFDFSPFPPGSEKEKNLLAAIRRASEGFQGRERRKTGIEKSGLAFLIACILEAIQQMEWTTPNK